MTVCTGWRIPGTVFYQQVSLNITPKLDRGSCLVLRIALCTQAAGFPVLYFISIFGFAWWVCAQAGGFLALYFISIFGCA